MLNHSRFESRLRWVKNSDHLSEGYFLFLSFPLS